MSRRRFIGAAGGAAAAAGCAPRAAPAPKGPINLLFLMTDQHHHGVLGCAGNPLVKTPNLDRLAAQGVRFTHATCPAPFCSPTRAAILTGRYPSTLGIWRNIKAKDDPLRFREPRRTYLHPLAARGYRCHQLGKWHLGHPGDLACFFEGRQDVEAPRQLLRQRRQAAGKGKFDHGPREGEVLIGDVFMTEFVAAKHRIWRNETRRSPQDLSIIGRSRLKPQFHYESVLADYCIELLRRHRAEPFAITCSMGPPHACWVAPARFYDLYDPARFELPASWRDWPEAYRRSQPARMGRLFGEEGLREYLRCYYAQVTMMDWCFGRILDELERLGLAGRTLVVFTSDHGDMQAAHGMMGKSVPAYYDEILRVPLLLRLPGVIPAGRASDALTSSVDLAPTILDLLGAEPLPGAHGRSLRAPFAGAPDGERAAFCERGQPGSRACSRMIRAGGWKLGVYAHGRHELYDLANDPGETKNLARGPAGRRYATQTRLNTPRPAPAPQREYAARSAAARRERLAQRLRAHMKRIGDPALPTLFREG